MALWSSQYTPFVEDSTARTVRLPDGRRLGDAEWADSGGWPLLYLHGWPGARIEGRLGDEAARAIGVRLIASRTRDIR